MMKAISALKENACQDSSNAKTKTAHLRRIFVMVEMIVEIDLMSYFAIMSAPIISSNVTVMVDAYLVRINVMEIKIVLMDPTKLTKFVVSRIIYKNKVLPYKA